MIDPATGWFEMAQIPNKTAAEIADITKKTWFTRYPPPQQIVFDRGTEFMAEFAKMCHNDYGLKRKPITPSVQCDHQAHPSNYRKHHPYS